MNDDRRWARGRGAAARIDRVSQRLDDYAQSANPIPELGKQVRALAESQWGEPVVVVHLGDVKPAFDVPGRRKDGTVKGTRLVRRFFWNIVRGTVGGLAAAVMLVVAGGAGNVFARSGSVRGPANAQALGLVDAAMSATGPWLVYSARTDIGPSYTPKHVAVVDPPNILWHATADAPRISPRRQRITWPDGSEFQYDGKKAVD
jgi:hypothetical protein